MKCLLCSISSKTVINNFPGYLKNTFFKIYYCKKCNTSFIDPKKVDEKIYEKIYSQLERKNNSVKGYSDYNKYAKQIKKTLNPIQFLIEKDNTYFPTYNFVKDKSKLKILEIGCGYGYLTYALRKLGHEVIGIDISKTAIEFAKNNFGGKFYERNIENLNFKENSFDLIIATELIEHLSDINLFITKSIKLLKNNGFLLISTPNKPKNNNENYWETDNPPVHVFWLSTDSFKFLGEKYNLNIEFMKNSNPYYKHNMLAMYLYVKFLSKFSIRDFALSEKEATQHNSKLHYIRILTDLWIVRKISNFIYFNILRENLNLSVLISKKN
jgi:2-polyprenyl-3-methyl-5-hydroxy-6-metoxy-1,4-benzoquinol methylase